MPSRNVIEIIISAKDDASKQLEGTDSILGKLGKTAAIGATAIVGATTAIGAGLFELAREAAPIEGVQRAFEGLAKSSGKSMDEVLDALKKGSLGMATNTDLMKSYNSAAQLVSIDFANQLPDAMKYLSKVSAATGQDMGFMIDSLVKGVGRVSPMILDNLGIQVNATEAMEEYAKANGKAASELTKTEQQAAIMAKVLQLLEKNTASMPDVTDNASTKWAQFQTRLADFKDDIGVKLLPFFSTVIDMLMRIADVVLPIIMPVIEGLARGFGTFFTALSDGANPLAAFGMAISSAFGGTNIAVNTVLNTIHEKVNEIAPIIGGFIQNLVTWFTGTALPALQKFGAWFTTEVLPVVVQFITGTVIPAIGRFISILQSIWEMVAPVLASLVDWFINTGLPLAVGFIRDTMIPYIQKLIEGIMVIWEKVQPGLQNLFDWFVTTGLPAITGFIENTAVPIVSEIIRIIGDIWTAVSPALGDFAAWFLEDALPGVVNFIEGTVIPTIDGIINIIKAIWTAVQPALSSFKSGVEGVMKSVSDAIQPVVEFIERLIGKFQQVQAAVGEALGGGAQAWQGAANNASIAANLVSSGQVSPGQFFDALGNAIRSQFSSHAIGSNRIPEDGLYRLHEGEKVTPAGDSNVSTSLNISFSGSGAPQNQGEADDSAYMLVNGLRAAGVNI